MCHSHSEHFLQTQNEGDISRPESSKAITEKDATVKPKPKRNSVFLSTTDVRLEDIAVVSVD